MEDIDIAIIGGGPCGLVALYECKKRNYKTILYEKESKIGGVWNLNSSSIRAHHSTVFNTSTFLSSFNLDFPLFQYLHDKNDRIDYPSASDFNGYLNEFMSHYELDRFVSLHKEVIEIICERGGFTLRVKDVVNGQEARYHHGYVIMASGNNGHPIIPPEPFLSHDLPINVDRIWHTTHWDPLNCDSASWETMEGNEPRILIMGNGASSAEAIQDTITRSKLEGNYDGLRIYWAPTSDSSRHNVWLVDFYPYGKENKRLAADEIICRFYSYLSNLFTNREAKKICTNILSHLENTIPDIFRDRLCICDKELIKKGIRDGIFHIVSQPITRIHKSTSNRILFETADTNSIEVDQVIMGSGFTFNEPRINNKFIVGKSRFYRNIIPIDGSFHGRIGYIATTQVMGSILSASQMQIKWLLYQWFNENNKLQKTLDKMRLQGKTVSMDTVYRRKPLGKLMDELAMDMNFMPNVWRNLFSVYNRQRHLALACLVGPWSIYQYATDNETDQERLRRENIILYSTENMFHRCGKNFKYFTFAFDVIYFLIFGAIASLVALNILKVLFFV